MSGKLLASPDTQVLYDSAVELETKLRQLLQLVDVTTGSRVREAGCGMGVSAPGNAVAVS